MPMMMETVSSPQHFGGGWGLCCGNKIYKEEKEEKKEDKKEKEEEKKDEKKKEKKEEEKEEEG